MKVELAFMEELDGFGVDVLRRGGGIVVGLTDEDTESGLSVVVISTNLGCKSRFVRSITSTDGRLNVCDISDGEESSEDFNGEIGGATIDEDDDERDDGGVIMNS